MEYSKTAASVISKKIMENCHEFGNKQVILVSGVFNPFHLFFLINISKKRFIYTTGFL